MLATKTIATAPQGKFFGKQKSENTWNHNYGPHITTTIK